MIVADQAPVENWDADNAAVAVAAEDQIVAPAGVFLHSVPVGQQDCVIRVDFGAQFRAGFLSRRAVGVVHAPHGQSGAVAGPQFILVAEHTYAVLAQQIFEHVHFAHSPFMIAGDVIGRGDGGEAVHQRRQGIVLAFLVDQVTGDDDQIGLGIFYHLKQ